ALLWPVAADAATYIVNTTADTFDNVCDAADCSIKDAVFEADSTPQFDVIELQPGALYVVTNVSATTLGGSAYPRITTPMRVNGHGATLQRPSSAPDMRFFEVDTTGSLTLDGLTLLNGGFTAVNYWGGAIFTFGDVTIDNCIFKNNHVNSAGGAG